MTDFTFWLVPVRADKQQAIDELLDAAFGAGRRVRMAERLREGNVPVQELCFMALGDDEAVLGAIAYWRICIGETEALMLGPLVVSPSYGGRGIGRALIDKTLALAREQGYGLVFLVGDEPYYRASGFVPAPLGLIPPAPVDYARLLICPLREGAGDNLSGALRPASVL